MCVSNLGFMCLKYFHIIYYRHYDNATAPLGSKFPNCYWQRCFRRILKKGFLDIQYKSALVCFMTARLSPAFCLFFHDAAQMSGRLEHFPERSTTPMLSF